MMKTPNCLAHYGRMTSPFVISCHPFLDFIVMLFITVTLNSGHVTYLHITFGAVLCPLFPYCHSCIQHKEQIVLISLHSEDKRLVNSFVCCKQIIIWIGCRAMLIALCHYCNSGSSWLTLLNVQLLECFVNVAAVLFYFVVCICFY